MTIRSKLIVLLAVPLAALAVVAIWAFRDVNTDAEVLEDTEISVTAIANLEALWTDLSKERLAVVSGTNVAEFIETTDMTVESIVSQNDAVGAAVAADAVASLPINRRGATSDDYSDALDIVEAGIGEQSLVGFSSDSVLRTVFLNHAREASRIQEEAWIGVLESGGAEVADPVAVRELVSASPNAVAAREQALSDRLSDGSRPFENAATIAAGTGNRNTLAVLEASFATDLTFGDASVEDAAARVAQLSDDEIVETLIENRLAWSEDGLVVKAGLRSDLGGEFAEINDTRSLALFIALLGGLLLLSLIHI